MSSDFFKVALQAGALFALWPILMNRSGLTGNPMAFAFALICFLTVLPFTMGQVNWGIMSVWSVSAGIFAGFGLLKFANLLGRVSKEQVSDVFVLVLVTQVVVAAIYKVTLTGLTLKTALGFIGAIIVAILLK